MACMIDKCQTLGAGLYNGGSACASGLFQVAQTGAFAICHAAKITAGFLSSGANAIATVALSALAATAACFQNQAMIAAGFFAVHQAFIIPLLIGAAIPTSIFLIAAIATSCLKGNESEEQPEGLLKARAALVASQKQLEELTNTTNERIEELEKNLGDSNTTNENLRRMAEEKEDSLEEANRHLIGSRDDVEKLKQENGELKAELTLTQEQLGTALGEKDVLERTFNEGKEEFRNLVEELKRENNQLKAQLNGTEQELGTEFGEREI